MEREITEPVDLCRPDGRLNPDAVGWTRRPLHRANLRGWGRAKRWEYWGVVTDRFCLGLTASSLDYAGVCAVWVLDRETGRTWQHDAVPPLARGVSLPPDHGGVARVEAGGLHLELSGSALRASAPGIEVDLAVEPGGECLGVVVPWSGRRFQYTVKDVGRAVRGTLRLDETAYDVSGRAVLDHGRGKWPYAITWNWAAGFTGGSGGGPGITLGGKWTDGTGTTENGLFVDGRMHKISDELAWEYDRTDWLRPWRIHGPRVDLRFEPFHERADQTNLGVVANETHQCFGHFTGWASTDDGERVDLGGLVGWAEEARNRW
ncbi:DUF2804 domain-containing protein [Nocardioides sp.]|uniref:DUF2804 domain-containing protein n=1 Tax=Nocardioides sp. TaxID=35761 RepID=UPI0037834C79